MIVKLTYWSIWSPWHKAAPLLCTFTTNVCGTRVSNTHQTLRGQGLMSFRHPKLCPRSFSSLRRFKRTVEWPTQFSSFDSIVGLLTRFNTICALPLAFFFFAQYFPLLSHLLWVLLSSSDFSSSILYEFKSSCYLTLRSPFPVPQADA